MKSISVLSLTTLAAVVSLASAAQAMDIHPNFKGGFYFGAAVGGSSLENRYKLLANGINHNFKDHNTRFSPGVMLGFSQRVGLFSAGIEVDGFLNNNKAKTSLSSGDISVTQKNNHDLRAALKLGYNLTSSTSFYGSFGLNYRPSKLVIYTSGTSAKNINKSYKSTAFAPGIGLEVAFAPNLNLRAEYRTAFHKTRKFMSADQTTTLKMKARSERYLVGLTYQVVTR